MGTIQKRFDELGEGSTNSVSDSLTNLAASVQSVRAALMKKIEESESTVRNKPPSDLSLTTSHIINKFSLLDRKDDGRNVTRNRKN